MGTSLTDNVNRKPYCIHFPMSIDKYWKHVCHDITIRASEREHFFHEHSYTYTHTQSKKSGRHMQNT